jgi:hypothetical protein
MNLVRFLLPLLLLISSAKLFAAPPKWGDDGLYYFKQNDKFGYMDKTGKVVIPPKYHYAGDFYNGMACVMLVENSLYGYINKTGTLVIKPQYAIAKDFSDDVAWVGAGKSVGMVQYYTIIDKTGKAVITKFKNDLEFKPFTEGLAAVKTSGKWSYINKAGQTVIPAKYDEAYIFSEGLARVTIGEDTDGYIDKTGKIIIKPQFYLPGNFSEGLADVQLYTPYKDGNIVKRGYIDKTGNYVIELKYAAGYQFSEGIAAVKDLETEEIYFINKSGEKIIEARKYDMVYPFTQGLAAVSRNDKYGFIDKTGAWVIEPEYDVVFSFSKDGLAYFILGDKFGYIDKTGKVLWKQS